MGKDIKSCSKTFFLTAMTAFLIVLMAVFSTGYSDQTDNLHYYTYDSDADDYYGISDGTIYGATNVAANVSNGYFMDGTNDYIRYTTSGTPLKLNGSGTISFFGKMIDCTNTSGDWKTTVDFSAVNTGTYAQSTAKGLFIVQESGVLRFRARNGSTYVMYSTNSGDCSNLENKWLFHTFTFDYNPATSNLTIKYYRNGNYYGGTSGILPSVNFILSDMRVGRDQSTVYYYNGTIDELLVSARAWSASEISTLYDDYASGIRPTDSEPESSLIISTPDENMNLTSSVITGDFSANITVAGHHFYFGLENVQNKLVNITVTNPQVGFNNATSSITPVYTCDGINWEYVDGKSYNGKFRFWLNVTECDDIKIGDLFKTSYTEAISFIEDAEESSYASIVSDTVSAAGNRVIILKITNDDSPISESERRIVFVIAEQHGNAEIYGHFIARGMVDYLISEDEIADVIRDNSVFYVAVMMNPDSLKEGTVNKNLQGLDLNDYWFKNNASEVNSVREFANNLSSDYGIDFFFDIHGLGGNEPTSYMTTFNTEILGAVNHNLTIAMYNNISALTDLDTKGYEGTPDNETARSYFWSNLGVVGLTIEPSECNAIWSLDELIDTGANISVAIANYFGFDSSPDEPVDLLHYYTYDSDSKDYFGLSNGTDTDVSYGAANVSNGALFNGLTSIIRYTTSGTPLKLNGSGTISFFGKMIDCTSGTGSFNTSVAFSAVNTGTYAQSTAKGVWVAQESGVLRLRFRNASSSFTLSTNSGDCSNLENQWVMHTFTFSYDDATDNLTASYYRNGQYYNGGSSIISNMNFNLGDMRVGRDQSTVYYYNGTIDELAISDEEWTGEQIEDVYQDYSSGIRPID